jgi:GAF domain-containing protein
MPHLRCLGCGVVSYAPVGSAGSCPECGVPWPPRPDRVIQSADPEQRLGALVRMTRDLLDVDLALLTEIRTGRETVLLSAGGWPGMWLGPGDWLPLEETFCRLMLEGRIDNLVPDAPAEPAVAGIELVRRLGARAYLGVPVRPSDAELYVLCCLAREVRPSLGLREVRLLSGLAESVSAELRAR